MVGDRRQDLCNGAGSAPRYDVLRAATGTFQLGVGWRHVYFDALPQLERGRVALEVEAFGRCTLQVFEVGAGVAMESSDRDLDRGGSQCRCEEGGGLGTLLGIVKSGVVERGRGVRVRRGESGDGRGSIVHFERRMSSE